MLSLEVLILAILMGLRWTLRRVLIHISLLNKEHLRSLCCEFLNSIPDFLLLCFCFFFLQWKSASSESQRNHSADLPTPPPSQKAKACSPLHWLVNLSKPNAPPFHFLCIFLSILLTSFHLYVFSYVHSLSAGYLLYLLTYGWIDLILFITNRKLLGYRGVLGLSLLQLKTGFPV